MTKQRKTATIPPEIIEDILDELLSENNEEIESEPLELPETKTLNLSHIATLKKDTRRRNRIIARTTMDKSVVAAIAEAIKEADKIEIEDDIQIAHLIGEERKKHRIRRRKKVRWDETEIKEPTEILRDIRGNYVAKVKVLADRRKINMITTLRKFDLLFNSPEYALNIGLVTREPPLLKLDTNPTTYYYGYKLFEHTKDKEYEKIVVVGWIR